MNHFPYPLILASSSPRRRDLLTSLGVTYTVIKPDVDESPYPNEAPLVYVRRISQEKAHAVATKLDTQHTILAADTSVILAADTIGIETTGELLGKPVSADEARIMLQRLRNRVHLVCTAFTLLITDQLAYQHTEIVTTYVTMRDYSDAEIQAYIATGDPFDKAGSYAIQHPIFNPVVSLNGSYTNVMGLPLEAVSEALRRVGFTLNHR